LNQLHGEVVLERIYVDLARTFQEVFMPLGLYDSDPTPYIENKISTSDLKNLFDALPDDKDLAHSDHKALLRLKCFLDGDFKGGVGFQQLRDESHEDAEGESAPSGV
jgi:hypothetical protein